MRASWVVIAVLLVWCPLALAQETEGDRQAAILKELRALRQSVDELSLRVQALEERLVPSQPDVPVPGLPPQLQSLIGSNMPSRISRDGDSWQRRGANAMALSRIPLAEDPTKEQAREYVRQILALSANQNSWSSTDPQPAFLRRVGPAHVDVLLEMADMTDSISVDCYIRPAVVALAREEHKELILEQLPYRHWLVQVVSAKDWTEDARETLIGELRSGSRGLPEEWIQTVASLRDPETYGDLVKYFIDGENREETYRALQMLPIQNMDKAVADAWQVARGRDRWEAREMACIAVAHGMKDALRYTVSLLAVADPDEWTVRKAREVISRYTDARGSNQELVAWYRDNADRLTWDADRRRFRVEESAPAATQ